MTEPFKFDGPGYYRTADGRKALVGSHAGELAGCVFCSLDGREALIARIWKPCGASNFSGDTLTGPWVDPPPIEAWALSDNGFVKSVWLSKPAAEYSNERDGTNYKIIRLTELDEALLKAAEDVCDDATASGMPFSCRIVATDKIDALRAAVNRARGK